MSKKKNTSSYPLPVRVVTILLIVAVASGMLYYLGMMIANLLG